MLTRLNLGANEIVHILIQMFEVSYHWVRGVMERSKGVWTVEFASVDGCVKAWIAAKESDYLPVVQRFVPLLFILSLLVLHGQSHDLD